MTTSRTSLCDDTMFRLMFTKLNIHKISVDSWKTMDPARPHPEPVKRTSTASTTASLDASVVGAAAAGAVEDIDFDDFDFEELSEEDPDIDNGDMVWEEVNDEFYMSEAEHDAAME